jgi:hypothetical protein
MGSLGYSNKSLKGRIMLRKVRAPVVRCELAVVRCVMYFRFDYSMTKWSDVKFFKNGQRTIGSFGR